MANVRRINTLKSIHGPIEAVIFDFDFTLADSSEPIIECVANFAFEAQFSSAFKVS